MAPASKTLVVRRINILGVIARSSRKPPAVFTIPYLTLRRKRARPGRRICREVSTDCRIAGQSAAPDGA
jgi:hypothetical protein